jgi:gas vesicle protein
MKAKTSERTIMASAKQRVSDVRPYVERAMRDDELRDSLKNAFQAAKDVYDQLIGPRGATGMATRVATDKDVQENLKRIADELRNAADRVQRKDDHTARNMLFLLSGIAIGLLFNPFSGPTTRKWLKEKVTGSEPEFSYQGNSGSS